MSEAPTTQRRVRLRSPLTIVIVLVVILALATLFLRPPTLARGSAVDPQNPGPEGAMAVAQILTKKGITVNVVRTVSSALASPGEALVITSPNRLTDEQLEALADQGRDAILLDVRSAVHAFLPEMTAQAGPGGRVEAGCDDPRAQAGPISTTARQLWTPGATTCFPGDGPGTMLTAWSAGGFQVTVLPQDILRNSFLTDESNAALALRTLGEHSSITWLVASLHDPYPMLAEPSTRSLEWFYYPVVILFLAIAWWRGPRFGRLSAEPLPVVVPASETTIGRGHLYHAANDLDHAATSLRLGALNRIASRIGLPASAHRPEIVTAVALASTRTEAEVAELLYGPAPTSTPSLQALALSLDALVDEVEHS